MTRAPALTAVGDLCQVTGGGTPSRAVSAFWNGHIPWVSPKDMKTWRISDAEEHVTLKALAQSASKLVQSPAVLLVVRGMILRRTIPVAVTTVPVALNQDMKALLPNPNVDAEYLALMLKALEPELLRKVETAGHGTGRLATDSWRSIKVPLRSLEDQRRIVSRVTEFTNRIDEIALLRRASDLDSTTLHDSLVADLLPRASKQVLLGDVCTIEGTLVDPLEARFHQRLHVGGANIVAGTGELIDLRSARDERLRSGKHLFTQEDVLYNKIRPYLRKVARPGFAGLCSADMYPLRPKSGVLDRGFLYYLLLSRAFTTYAVRVSNRAGMPKVNRVDLFKFSFGLPPLEEQRRAVDRLDIATRATRSLATRIGDVAQSASRLPPAILRKAFAGEL